MLQNLIEKMVGRNVSSIYLSIFDITLISDKTSLPSKKLIHVFSKDECIGTLVLDERDSTILDGRHYNDKVNPIISEISEKFKEFKKSNINYGTLGTGIDFEYSGTDYISVDKFFDYLKVENRNQTIESITKN
jgi:hypothetical protein